MSHHNPSLALKNFESLNEPGLCLSQLIHLAVVFCLSTTRKIQEMYIYGLFLGLGTYQVSYLQSSNFLLPGSKFQAGTGSVWKDRTWLYQGFVAAVNR